MRIYVDIGHPAYFHFMRNFMERMKQKNHSFLVTCRDMDVTLDLLAFYNISFIPRGKGAHTSPGRWAYALYFFVKHFWDIRKFNPDICVGIGSPYLVMMAYLLQRPGIVFEDTEIAKKILWIYKHFATVILTPSCFQSGLGEKQLFLSSYKELAYLHKDIFSPDPAIFQLLQLPPGAKYMLFRFVSHQVNHDRPADGLTDAMKHTLIEKLSPYAHIFVSTERGIKSPFPQYELRVPPEQMHHVIAYAAAVIGESATMAAEAAVLGVPAIFFDNAGRGYTTELGQKYQLVTSYGISDESVDHAINKAIAIIHQQNDLTFRENYFQLYRDTINITDFLVWFVENYPESHSQMKKDPGYQFHFKS